MPEAIVEACKEAARRSMRPGMNGMKFVVCTCCGAIRPTSMTQEPTGVVVEWQTQENSREPCTLCTEVARRSPEVYDWAQGMLSLLRHLIMTTPPAAKDESLVEVVRG